MCGACVDGTTLREHGTNQHDTGSGDDYSNLQNQGNSSSYWAARLKRDAPEYHKAEQVETIISRRKRAQQAARDKDGSELKDTPGRPESGDQNNSRNHENSLGESETTDYLTARIARDLHAAAQGGVSFSDLRGVGLWVPQKWPKYAPQRRETLFLPIPRRYRSVLRGVRHTPQYLAPPDISEVRADLGAAIRTTNSRRAVPTRRADR